MTSTVDLTGSSVPGISHGLTGYLARPAGAGPWPGVVVLFEIFGADEVMHRQADRMAAAGYLTLMPDLHSQGGSARCLVPTFRALGAGHGRPFNDIEAARRWLLDSPDCTGRVGSIGFCLGGGFALLTAASGFDATAVNYGPLPKDLDAALAGACPLVGSYGAKDRTLKGAAPTLEQGLQRAGITHDVKEYPQAGHTFMNDAEVGPKLLRPLMRVSGVKPEPVAAADAWRRIEAFFAKQLH